MSTSYPQSCPHYHVRSFDKWSMKGKWTAFQCLECDAYLRPQWLQVDALGRPLAQSPAHGERDEAQGAGLSVDTPHQAPESGLDVVDRDSV